MLLVQQLLKPANLQEPVHVITMKVCMSNPEMNIFYLSLLPPSVELAGVMFIWPAWTCTISCVNTCLFFNEKQLTLGTSDIIIM